MDNPFNKEIGLQLSFSTRSINELDLGRVLLSIETRTDPNYLLSIPV